MFFQFQLYLISTYRKLSNQINIGVNASIFYFVKTLYKTVIFKEYWAENGKTCVRLNALIIISFWNRLFQ